MGAGRRLCGRGCLGGELGGFGSESRWESELKMVFEWELHLWQFVGCEVVSGEEVPPVWFGGFLPVDGGRSLRASGSIAVVSRDPLTKALCEEVDCQRSANADQWYEKGHASYSPVSISSGYRRALWSKCGIVLTSRRDQGN